MSEESILQTITRASSLSMARQFDAVVGAIVAERCGTLDPSALKGRLMAYTMPDGTTTYEIDGVPVATFWPAEVAIEGAKVTTSQRYVLHKEN